MKFIAYKRVSTDRQGASGLGLEAQQETVARHVQEHNGKVLATYTEVESGKRSDRPELAKALAHARRSKATLIVAKLDRLSRNVAFLSALLEANVPIVFADMPNADKLTLHVLAAVAEQELRAIKKRTTDALAVLKARGVKLGSAREGHWDGKEHLRQAGLAKARTVAAEVNRERKSEAYADILPEIQQHRAEGLSLRQIAHRLNESGHTTRRGRPWNQVQVARLVAAPE